MALPAFPQDTKSGASYDISRNYGKDVASFENGAQCSKGCTFPNVMLRTNWTEYNGSTGYTFANSHVPIQVNFRMAYVVNTLKFLLWDQDNRTYDYKIEVSKDEKAWYTVCNVKDKQSWQEVQIDARPIKHVRLIGTGGKNNHSQLHIVKFMAYFDYSR
mmetsp:Transcript_56832/g.94522  ORF Transcript_56832/g.94522 Transcript_56832/m.94522 type:complete len:159 (-) Transcript_56832:28-504(-)